MDSLVWLRTVYQEFAHASDANDATSLQYLHFWQQWAISLEVAELHLLYLW